MNAHPVNSILTIAIAVRAEENREQVTREITRILAEDPSIRVMLEQREGQLALGSDDELELEAISKMILEVGRSTSER